LGSSVAREREARESIIRLTQSSYIGYNGDSLPIIAPINVMIQAPTLTVS